MMTDPRTESTIARWLADGGPELAPADVIEAAFLEARSASQRPRWRIGDWWGRQLGANLAGGPVPGARRAALRLELGRTARIAWAIALLALLATALAAALFVGLGSRTPPLPALACPAGSTPDEAGPPGQARPPTADPMGRLVWDSGGNRMLYVAQAVEVSGGTPAGDPRETTVSDVWSFDVCTNTWGRLNQVRLTGRLGLLIDAGRAGVLAFDDRGVLSHDSRSDNWTRRGDYLDASPGGPASGPLGDTWPTPAQAFHVPERGLILVRNQATWVMWAYEPASDRWWVADRSGPLGRDGARPETTNCGTDMMGYDRTARIVIAMVGCDPTTWLFDPATGMWADVPGAGPQVDLGFCCQVDAPYDTVNQRMLLFADGRVAARDSRTGAWELASRDVTSGSTGPYGRQLRVGHASAYDPVNGRLVVFGGSARLADPETSAYGDWRMTDDVVAFDYPTRAWVQLLAPSGRAAG